MNAGGNTTIFDKDMNRIIKDSYEVIALDNIAHEAYIVLHDNITCAELLEIRKVIEYMLSHR